MFQAVILGIVQALTEFLPVSSSGHLYIIQRFLDIKDNLLPFFVWLHLATLLAIVAFFLQDIFSLFKKKKFFMNIAGVTVLSSIIAFVIDVILEKYFNNHILIGISFLFTSILLFSTKDDKGKKDISCFDSKDAVWLGIMQGFAVFPGISRSGITIVTLLKRGFRPLDAFRLSFLAGIPVIFAAFLWEVRDIFFSINTYNVASWVVGFSVTFLAGIFSLKFLRRLVTGRYFYIFGYYCVMAGLFTLLILPLLV